MFAPIEWFIGTRYIYARRGNHFIGFISLTAVVATALGVTVLLTILSIMNGFEGELRDRILGLAAHLEITADDSGAPDWASLEATAAAATGVAGTAPYLSRDVLVMHAGVVRAVEVRGIVPAAEQRVTALAEHLEGGTAEALEGGAYRVLIGRELANAFGLRRGDYLTLITPQPTVTPAGLVPRLKRFVIADIFEFGLQEHDANLVLIAMADAQRLFRAPGRIDGIRVRLDDAGDAPAVKQALTTAYTGIAGLRVQDWTDTHSNLFRALKTEKVAMFVILALAIAIAAFNVVSILVVAVTEKRGDIAILSALGCERRDVMRIFLVQGGVTGALGVTIGLACGILLALNVGPIVGFVEQVFGFKVLSPDVYYISDVPSDLRRGDVIATALLAGLTSFTAPLYPAWLAASMQASEGLHHE